MRSSGSLRRNNLSRSNGLERTGHLKIGVIGAGAVGSACLLSSILRGIAREIVVVNRDRKRAKAVVTDLQYGAALSSVVQIRDGDYSDLTGAALVISTPAVRRVSSGNFEPPERRKFRYASTLPPAPARIRSASETAAEMPVAYL